MLMFQTLARRSDELRGISWRALDCEDVDSTGSSSKFYVKSVFSRHSYCVFATDFQTLWVEDVPADVLETKFDESYLSSATSELRGQLTEALGQQLEVNRPGCKYKLQRGESERILTVDFEYSRAPVKWDFRLRTLWTMLGPSLSPELPEKLFYVHVVGPLLVLADEYKRRMSRLEELLRLKDSDIDTIFAEYHVDTEKAKLKTVIYTKDDFHRHMQTEFENSSRTTADIKESLFARPDDIVRYGKRTVGLDELELVPDPARASQRAISASPQPSRTPVKPGHLPPPPKKRRDMSREELAATIEKQNEETKLKGAQDAEKRRQKQAIKEKERKFR